MTLHESANLSADLNRNGHKTFKLQVPEPKVGDFRYGMDARVCLLFG